ncbi:MAG TPA: monofunctional biosynthetic peptidoglycan transglycosylase [Rhodoferax sp.]|nr:monofunctional biosynthetic peptidoglycan transglycosylase [Rhodoferax sp.]
MKPVLHWVGLVVISFIALQLFFVARIGLMQVVHPESTAFQRSEAWQLVRRQGSFRWQQQWVPYARISDNLKRAVIASEDDNFVNNDGVEWEAIEKAWQKNAKAEALAAQRTQRSHSGAKPPRIVGASTITQQLAKNLFLSGERTLLRKGQELALTMLLDRILGKRRVLEIYLNSVEWGTGVFGAEAAAERYYHKPAARLTAYEAARLAVMLPRPKYFERVPNSGYLASRASTIVARMRDAELP